MQTLKWPSSVGCPLPDTHGPRGTTNQPTRPSLVTAEPGLPATYYLPRTCIADVQRLQGILCKRTRGAVGIRARVPVEVSGRGAATVVVPTLRVAVWSTACGQRDSVQEAPTNFGSATRTVACTTPIQHFLTHILRWMHHVHCRTALHHPHLLLLQVLQEPSSEPAWPQIWSLTEAKMTTTPDPLVPAHRHDHQFVTI
ncbi:uncharacterized protein LOC142771540 isoform X2 [Rhipicephalus microplus]|uniref:uncharacterized protein LOC142771540 isoform X2 n=1 Tax=Rhipicephalus microplus TaxID=6941 RepID=UPI003F6BF20E